jgi:hypothetical protein
MENFTPGVYKNEKGSFGFLNPEGSFILAPSRSQARLLSKANNFSTTTKGVFIAPKEKPVKPVKKTYEKHNIGKKLRETSRGEILCEVTKEDFYRVYMNYLMYAKRHREARKSYLYAKMEDGSAIFVRW